MSKNHITTFVDGNDGESIDIFQKLLTNRTIFLTTDIDSDVANIIKAQLLYLDSISNDDITIMIDSGGGDIYTSLGLIDIMDLCKSDIVTVNIGLAASMAAVILSCGTKGKRKSLMRSRTMVHQPLAWSGNEFRQATDIEIDAREINSLKEDLIEIFSERTGKSKLDVKTHMERDYWLNSKQALDYGIIDEIIKKK